jgi:pimeloyl-ACP methyl ester carboxylesterase
LLRRRLCLPPNRQDDKLNGEAAGESPPLLYVGPRAPADRFNRSGAIENQINCGGATMFVTVNDVRLFFDVLSPKLEIEGASLREKPVLICLPGGPGGDHQTIRPAFDRFTNVAQVIYLDHRASGRSERGDPARWTLDQWGNDVAAFCDALGLEKPIILGVSGGAIVTQAFLAQHPDRAAGAILINPCSRMEREALIAGFAMLGGPASETAARAMYTRGAPEDVPGFFEHCLPFYSRKGKFSDMRLSGGRSTFNLDVSQHFFGPGGEAYRYDHRRRLGAVKTPVLALAGAHDPVTRPEWGREVAEALPPGICEFHLFEDASHLILSDEPERFTAVVEAFIRARS